MKPAMISPPPVTCQTSAWSGPEFLPIRRCKRRVMEVSTHGGRQRYQCGGASQWRHCARPDEIYCCHHRLWKNRFAGRRFSGRHGFEGRRLRPPSFGSLRAVPGSSAIQKVSRSSLFAEIAVSCWAKAMLGSAVPDPKQPHNRRVLASSWGFFLASYLDFSCDCCNWRAVPRRSDHRPARREMASLILHWSPALAPVCERWSAS